MSKMNMLRKFTVKAVMGDLKKLLLEGKLGKENGDQTPLIRILASLSDVQTRVTEDDQGNAKENYRFLGAIEATNLITNEVYSAPVGFFPAVIAEAILQSVKEGNNVQFAGTIGVEIDLSSATSYVYTFKPDVMQKADALSALRALAAVAPVAVDAKPAPVDADPAPAPADTASKKK